MVAPGTDVACRVHLACMETGMSAEVGPVPRPIHASTTEASAFVRRGYSVIGDPMFGYLVLSHLRPDTSSVPPDTCNMYVPPSVTLTVSISPGVKVPLPHVFPSKEVA